jgi:hypothetical protein
MAAARTIQRISGFSVVQASRLAIPQAGRLHHGKPEKSA